MKQSRESSGRLAKRNGVTIDGVLNAFNGAASQEGRVLILATNKPASLDEALIRPGRVDLKLCFENITKNHARDLFWRMYTPDTSAETNELVKLAAEFGSKISEKIFSPAEVQNYLIVHKDQPRQALSGVTDWVEAMKQKSRRHRGKPCAKVPTKCRKKDEQGSLRLLKTPCPHPALAVDDALYRSPWKILVRTATQPLQKSQR